MAQLPLWLGVTHPILRPFAQGIARSAGRDAAARPILILMPRFALVTWSSIVRGGPASIGPAGGQAAPQIFLIGAGGGRAQGFPPGALGGRVSAEAEMQLADHRVPTRVAGGD